MIVVIFLTSEVLNFKIVVISSLLVMFTRVAENVCGRFIGLLPSLECT